MNDISNTKNESYFDYAKFMARVSANYLDSKVKYDPIAVFLSSKIDLVPYQIYDFNRLISEERNSGNIRALIAYETGLGKTILVGMIIKELLTRGTTIYSKTPTKRVLIVTPPTVLPQFRDEMKRRFNLDFMEVSSQTGTLPDLTIASMDTIKMKDWMERLGEQTWDLIVVDEFHRISPSNLRGKLFTLLSLKTRHFIALTATPHDGRSDRYAFRLKTISASPIIIRRTKREAVDINNKKIFDQVVSEKKEEFPVTDEENQFYDDAERYAKERYKGSQAGALVAVVIGRAVSSSIRAGVKLFSRRQNNLLLEDFSDIESEELEDLYDIVREGGELSETDIDRILKSKPENRQELEAELALIQPLIQQGKNLINSMIIDSKGKYLLDLINREPIKGRKFLVFTGFIETVNYLKELLEKNGNHPFLIIGSVDMEERNRIVNRFAQDDRYTVLIGTDAMGESLNLQAASVEINYEVPWSPVSYIQRVGRIWRFGQKNKDLYIHNFLPAFDVEKRVIEVILEKIKTISEEFGEVGLSVFGRELGSVDSLLKQAYADEKVEIKIEDAYSKTREIGNEVMDTLKSSMSLPSVVNVAELQRANFINLDDTFSENDLRKFLDYLHDIGLGSGRLTDKDQHTSTFVVKKGNEYLEIKSLSLNDEGVQAAIEIGLNLNIRGAKLDFNYFKDLEGRLIIIETKVNGLKVFEEPLLVTVDSVLPYRGIIDLAPAFTNKFSNVTFFPFEEYKAKTGLYWLDRLVIQWEEAKKVKVDAILREKDEIKKEWLRRDLANWINSKPNRFEVTETQELCKVNFIRSINEESWKTKYDVESKGMTTAWEYYQSIGYDVKNVSDENRGYDFECKRNDGILRVEVKGLKTMSYPTLTQNEHRMAEFYGDGYILFIVKIEGLEESKYAVPNPIMNLQIKEVVKPVYEMTGFEKFRL